MRSNREYDYFGNVLEYSYDYFPSYSSTRTQKVLVLEYDYSISVNDTHIKGIATIVHRCHLLNFVGLKRLNKLAPLSHHLERFWLVFGKVVTQIFVALNKQRHHFQQNILVCDLHNLATLTEQVHTWTCLPEFCNLYKQKDV